MLSLKVPGRVDALLVDLGSVVQRGQIIARLTPTDFELRHLQADAALQQARALDCRRSERRQHDRISTFVARGISARADLESAEAQLQIAEGRYAGRARGSAQLARPCSRNAARNSRSRVSSSTTPCFARPSMASSASVSRLPASIGAAGTPIVTVVRQHPLRLQLAVPERAPTRCALGQTCARHASKAIQTCMKAAYRAAEPGDRRRQPHAADRSRSAERRRPAAARHLRQGRDRHREAERSWSCRNRRSWSLPASRRCWSSRTARRTSNASAPAPRSGDHVEIIEGLASRRRGHHRARRPRRRRRRSRHRVR